MADRKPLVLGVLYLGAAAWMAFEWQRPVPLPEQPEGNAPVSLPQPSAPNSQIGDIDAFTEFVERPLFVSGRRPPAEGADAAKEGPTATEAATEPGELADARLSAIIVDGDRFVALVERRNGSIDRLSVGGKLDNWAVEQINDDNVVLAANGRSHTLQVYRFDLPPPKQRPRKQTRRQRPTPRPTTQRRILRGPVAPEVEEEQTDDEPQPDEEQTGAKEVKQ